MKLENVTLIMDDHAYSGFTAVSIEAGMKEAARSFELSLVEHQAAVPGDQVWLAKPGTPVEIWTSDDPLTPMKDLMVKGYIDDYDVRYGKDDHSVTASGRSKSADLIDCAAQTKTGQFRNKNLKEIAEELDTYDVGVSSDIELEKIPGAQIRQGESCFDTIERLARQQGVCIAGEADGSIRLTKAGEKRHAGSLAYGYAPVLSASAQHSQSGRYKEYKVKGQKTLGSGDDALQVEVKATDEAIKRNRIKVIVVEGDTDDGRATKRAKWEANRAAGEGAKATYTVAGWRDREGEVWTPGKLIYVEDDLLHLDQDMTIEKVSFSQDQEEGTKAELSLVDPRALGGKKPGKGKKGKTKDSESLWDQDVETNVMTKSLGSLVQ